MSESTLTFDDIDSCQKNSEVNCRINLKQSVIVNSNRKFGQSEFYIKVPITDIAENKFEAYFTAQEIRKAVKRGLKFKSKGD